MAPLTLMALSQVWFTYKQDQRADRTLAILEGLRERVQAVTMDEPSAVMQHLQQSETASGGCQCTGNFTNQS